MGKGVLGHIQGWDLEASFNIGYELYAMDTLNPENDITFNGWDF